MRSALLALRVTGVAVALTALTAVTAPAAGAEDRDRDGVTVKPNPAEPGDRVKLEVRGCDGGWATATSSVFVSEVHLATGHDDRRALWGDAVITPHADPGWHDIRVKCDGRDERVRGSVQIRHRQGRDQDRDHDPGHDQGRDQGRDHGRDTNPNPHHTPVWPVHAGGGAMAAEVARTTDLAKSTEVANSAELAAAAKKSHGGNGPGLPQTVIGAVLAAAATLAVAGRALALRRRRSGE